MKISLYARFLDPAQGEDALAALVAAGADGKDLTALFPPHYRIRDSARMALASLTIPDFAVVTGDSALATALIGLAATSIVGGLGGYLQDHGVPQRLALDTLKALEMGHSVVKIQCPTANLGEFQVLEIINPYQAESMGRSGNYGKPVFRA